MSILGPWIEKQFGISKSLTNGLGNFNRLYIATTGGGKNVACHHDLAAEVVGQAAIVFNDFKGDCSEPLVAEIRKTGWDKIIVDDLGQETIVPVETVSVGTGAEENRRYEDNALEYLDAFCDTPLEDAPLKLDWTRKAIGAFQSLPKVIREKLPAYAMTYLFRPKTKLYKRLLPEIHDEDLYLEFSSFRSMHAATLLNTVSAAERLLERAYGAPALVRRDIGTGLDWNRIITEKWIVITRGAGSQDARRSVMRARNAELLRYVESGDCSR